MKIAGIIEARMGSSRLPGKVLLPLGGKPALERLIERVSRSRWLDEVIVATTTDERDQPIADLCARLGVRAFRGSEDDVLARVLGAAETAGADLICELMGDSPLNDPVLIDLVIAAHLAGDYDYTANYLPENALPMGFAAGVFSKELLRRVEGMTRNPVDRSHVTCFIYHNPKLFRLQGVAANAQLVGPNLRLCMDTREDYDVVSRVFEAVHREGGCPRAWEFVRHLREHPELAAINAHVRQKHVDEG